MCGCMNIAVYIHLIYSSHLFTLLQCHTVYSHLPLAVLEMNLQLSMTHQVI